ncbi:MAG: urease accessory protein UreD [Chloroflexota bacterium]
MKTGATGRIHLSFSARDLGTTSSSLAQPVVADHKRGTKLRVLSQEPPLRVIRAFDHQKSGALVHLHNISGGVLGGDQFWVKIDVEAGAHGLLTTTGSHRIYRHRDGYKPASQTMQVRLGHDAIFEYIPDSTIPYAHSRYWQKSHIQLAPGAKLIWSEILNPGREGFNERFAWDQFGSEMRIDAEEIPVLWEKWELDGKNSRFDSPALFGPWSYSATFVVCTCGGPADKLRQLEADLLAITQPFSDSNTTWGVSRLVKDGILVRGLSHKGRHLPFQLEAIHNCARQSLIGESLIRPRKIY